MSFGKRILELRRARRLTQRELAQQLEALGFKADFSYISKIENDSLQSPPSEQLIKGLAKALGADPEQLLDLAGKFNPSALQEVVSEIPEAGVLLRRLQSGRLSREQIMRLLEQTEGGALEE